MLIPHNANPRERQLNRDHDVKDARHQKPDGEELKRMLAEIEKIQKTVRLKPPENMITENDLYDENGMPK